MNTLVCAVAAPLPKNNKAEMKRASQVRRLSAGGAKNLQPVVDSFMIRVAL
jgi:hypothetical protein